MKRIDGAALIENLKWRYATKLFDPAKKIPAADWAVMEQSLVLSPSSFGLQLWKFFVIDTPELRQKLQAESWGQSQIVDASHLVVLAVKKDISVKDIERWVERISAVRGVTKESLTQYRDMMVQFISPAQKSRDINQWATHQVYIALGALLSTAAHLGIDACPMEGFIPDAYNQILGLTAKGYSATVLCTLGYRSSEDGYAKAPKVRYEQSEIISHV